MAWSDLRLFVGERDFDASFKVAPESAFSVPSFEVSWLGVTAWLLRVLLY